MKRRTQLAATLALMVGLSSLTRAACTATEENKGSSAAASSGTSVSVTATIHATGDLVAFSAWCAPSCSFASPAVTLGSQDATQTSVSGTSNDDTGAPYLFYILSAGASGSVTATLNLSSTPSEGMQIGYIDFSPSTGCTFSHDVDSSLGTGSGSNPDTPSITPSAAGEVLYGFVANANTMNGGSASSPWTFGTLYSTTNNADEYDLSSASGSTTMGWSGADAESWESLITSFAMSSSSGSKPGVRLPVGPF
jgi:hypothetical protein